MAAPETCRGHRSHILLLVVAVILNFTVNVNSQIVVSDADSDINANTNRNEQDNPTTVSALVDCGFPEASLLVPQGRFFLVNRTTTLDSLAELRCFNAGGQQPPAPGGRSHRIQSKCMPDSRWSAVDYSACLSQGYGPLRAITGETGRSLSGRLNAILWGIILGSLSCLLLFIILLLYRGRIFPEADYATHVHHHPTHHHGNIDLENGRRTLQSQIGLIPPPHAGRLGGNGPGLPVNGGNTAKSWIGNLFNKTFSPQDSCGDQAKNKNEFNSQSEGSSPRGQSQMSNSGGSPTSDVTTTTLENIYEEISSKRIIQTQHHHRTTSSSVYALTPRSDGTYSGIYSDGDLPRPSSAAAGSNSSQAKSTEKESRISKSEQVVVQNLYAQVDLVRKKHDRLLKEKTSTGSTNSSTGGGGNGTNNPSQSQETNSNTSQPDASSQAFNKSQTQPTTATIDELADHFPYENLSDYATMVQDPLASVNINMNNNDHPLAPKNNSDTENNQLPGHKFYYFGMK